MARRIKAGTTDVSVVIRIVDSTDGTPETGVVFNTSGIDLQYRRELAASVAITEATLAALTTAHADGGFLHIGNGYYRLDLPDAACATGATGVLVHGTVTGMVVIGEYIELVAYDPADGVRLGLTALPNAAADAAGGLIVSDAGGLDADAQRSDVAAILVDTGTTLDGRIPAALVGGRMDANAGAISGDAAAADNLEAALDGTGGVTITAALTGNVTGNLSGSVGSVTGNVGGNVVGSVASVTAGVTLAASAVQAIWDALTSALTTVGSIGKLLVDNINATISSRAAATDLATVAGYLDTEIAAILADTNELQTDWANGGRLDLILDARASQTSVDAVAGYVDTEVAAIITTLGTPAGASVSVDIAAVKAQTAAIETDTQDIQTRLPAALTAGGNMKSDALAISGSTESADRLERSTLAIVTGTCAALGSTTSIIASALSPTSAVNDQFKGRIITFDKDTTTTALRGQATDITAYTHATLTFTVTALTTAPAAGDTFTIT